MPAVRFGQGAVVCCKLLFPAHRMSFTINFPTSATIWLVDIILYCATDLCVVLVRRLWRALATRRGRANVCRDNASGHQAQSIVDRIVYGYTCIATHRGRKAKTDKTASAGFGKGAEGNPAGHHICVSRISPDNGWDS